MPVKIEAQEENVPGWLVTYGDMVTLLLCFFILLVSFRTMADDTIVKKAFGPVINSTDTQSTPGIKRGPGQAVLEPNPLSAIHRMLSGPIWQSLEDKLKITVTATMVREGVRLNFQDRSGLSQFELGQWELSPAMQESISRLVSDEALAGVRNKMIIRGHASFEPADSIDGSRAKLSYLRAREVMNVILDPARGRVNAENVRISAVSDAELMDWGQREKKTRERNRRFDIIVTEELTVISKFENPRH